MDLSDLKIGKELGKDWQPVGKFNAAAQRFTLWVAAPAAFSLAVAFAGYFQTEFPGSPFLFIIRGLGRIIMALMCLLLGLIRLILTGSPELIKGVADCFSGEYSMVYSPLLLGTFGMIFVIRILNRIGVRQSYPLAVVIISAFLLLILCSLPSEWSFGTWLLQFWNLLVILWGGN